MKFHFGPHRYPGASMRTEKDIPLVDLASGWLRAVLILYAFSNIEVSFWIFLSVSSLITFLAHLSSSTYNPRSTLELIHSIYRQLVAMAKCRCLYHM